MKRKPAVSVSQLGFDFAAKATKRAPPSVAELAAAGYFAPIDVRLAETLTRLAGDDRPLVSLAVAVASRQVRHGHVCAELSQLVQSPFISEDGTPIPDLVWPDLGDWKACLQSSKVASGDHPPLHLDHAGRLYLDRYHRYQSTLSRAILERAGLAKRPVDEAVLADGLSRLFTGGEDPDWQRIAAEQAVRRQFAVICGGPGTGKTSTVVRILALLQEQAVAAGRAPLHVALLAPTGKAAARLGESIAGAIDQLACDAAIKASIQSNASTIHRALGRNFDNPSLFRHGAANPLPAEVVVVDEASMIDLALMAKLIDAVRPDGRLILLGDENQLASVEAGAILGDITNAGASEVDGPIQGPIAASITRLVKSYRFTDTGGVGALASAIRAGDADRVLAALAAGDEAELITVDRDAAIADAITDGFVNGLAAFHDAETPAEQLTALGRFRILCAHRRGVAGVEQLNRVVAERLIAKGIISARSQWYERRPLMVLDNDYHLDLFNGDIGVVARVEGELRVCFTGPNQTVRTFAPGRLGGHESVYAMTVHKSQGSEFDEVVVVLPDQLSPILSRELLYTAVTRARKKVRVVARKEVIAEAVKRRIQRASGLRSKLWPA